MTDDPRPEHDALAALVADLIAGRPLAVDRPGIPTSPTRLADLAIGRLQAGDLHCAEALAQLARERGIEARTIDAVAVGTAVLAEIRARQGNPQVAATLAADAERLAERAGALEAIAILRPQLREGGPQRTPTPST